MDSLSLPNLERARATLELREAPAWQFWAKSNLLDKEPESSKKLAALWLDARLSVRSTRLSEEQIGPRTLAAVKDNTTEQTHIKRRIDAQPVPCSRCSKSPGRVACGACNGSGGHSLGDDDDGFPIFVTCGGCDGDKIQECDSCDGSGDTQRVEIYWVEDEVKTLRYAYPPDLPISLEIELNAYVESVEKWPASLSMPLDEQLVSGTYRNAPASTDMFHGFVIDGAIDRAREMIKHVCGDGHPIKQEVQAFALPLLYLRYPKVGVVLHHKVDGGIGLLVERA